MGGQQSYEQVQSPHPQHPPMHMQMQPMHNQHHMQNQQHMPDQQHNMQWTASGGFRGRQEKHITPGVLGMYISLMLGLPFAVFGLSVYTMAKHRHLEMMRNTSAPVTYVHYYMEQTDPVSDIEADHVWIRVPRLNETNANAVFASNQFSFERGHGGYMGTQVWRKGITDASWGFLLGGRVSHRVIFSIWDGSASHQALPGTDPVSLQNCERFGGEGTGAHCSIEYPLQQAGKVTVRMERVGRSADGHGDVWHGSVKNPSTGETLPLGSIFVPDMKGDGFGLLVPQGSCGAFQEYWRASGCEDQALSEVGLFGPYFNKRTLVPMTAEPKYKHGCAHEDVTACIPGFPCGKPSVFMRAGGTIKPSAAAGLNLWGGDIASTGV